MKTEKDKRWKERLQSHEKEKMGDSTEKLKLY